MRVVVRAVVGAALASLALFLPIAWVRAHRGGGRRATGLAR